MEAFYKDGATIGPHLGHTLATLWPHLYAPSNTGEIKVWRVISIVMPSEKPVEAATVMIIDQ